MYENILPSSGLYCAAIARTKGFSHHFFRSIDETLEFLLDQDKAGKTVFLAHASFLTEDNRKQTNVKSIRSFWLDIDCGEGKPYVSQVDGFRAVRNVCGMASLPMPMMVSSGNGLYAYWPLKEDLDPARWKHSAKKLRDVLEAYGLHADPARTCDTSSVLRPVGSTHKKDPDNPKTVKLLMDAEAVDFAAFMEMVHEAGLRKGVLKPERKKKRSIDAIDMGVSAPPPSSAYQVAKNCAQIRAIKDSKGNVDEPLWYAGIGVLRHCQEAPDIVHAWSEGHPAYSEEETDEKIKHHIESGTGPTTCMKFAEVNPSGCVGCPHRGNVRSPIRLGWIAPEEIEDAAEDGVEIIPPPTPFKRTAEGLFLDDGEGQVVKFYDQDLYVSAISYDVSLETTVLTIKHYLPHEGWLTFQMKAAFVNEKRMLFNALWENAVCVVGMKEKEIMATYIEGYAQKLQRNRKMGQLVSQMGWKELMSGRAFVLGSKVYHASGEIEEVSLAHNVPTAVAAVRAEGELSEWVKHTRFFSNSGTEPLAFAFLAGAFGAPLFKFTGLGGGLVCMLGKSGVGKTLVGRFALSAYGDPDDLIMLRDDTKVALMSRLGVYNNLPMYIDEVTNILPEELSEMAYRLTQGRDRARGQRDGSERKQINQWRTLSLVSSNSSLVEKLGSAKANADAEINRIFEYEVRAVPALTRSSGVELFRCTKANYGHAGQKFVEHIVRHADDHEARIAKLTEKLEAGIGAKTDERFWSAIIAVTLYGASIAKQLGLIDFDLKPVTAWCKEQLGIQRETKAETLNDSLSLLAQYLDDTSSNRLVVRPSPHNKQEYTVLDTPRGKLVARYELDTKRLYVSNSDMRTYFAKRHVAFNVMKSELCEMGIILDTTKRKVLGAHTQYAGAPQPCWEIDMEHPALGQVVARVVKSKPSDEGLTVAK